jgi:glycosyltransferase involved in cell wall biosynthesis
MKVLLAEPWWGGSHKQWAEGYAANSSHDVRIISRPGSNWRQRMRTAGFELAAEANQIFAEGWEPDIVLATDMMNVATFKRELTPAVPVVLYMHENQLTYGEGIDATHGGINADSVAAADLTIFNSQFHWSSFGEGLMALGESGLEALANWQEAVVVPVGIDFENLVPTQKETGPRTIVWNHRWEPDKDPAAFADALGQIEDLEWQLILLGERSESKMLDRIKSDFGSRIVHDGWANPAEYQKLLGRADIVVSTAKQEFFGVSIAEAVGAGAFPVLPNRLSYPELLGDEAPPGALYEGNLAPALRWALEHPVESRSSANGLSNSIRRFSWETVAPRLDAALGSAASD